MSGYTVKTMTPDGPQVLHCADLDQVADVLQSKASERIQAVARDSGGVEVGRNWNAGSVWGWWVSRSLLEQP